MIKSTDALKRFQMLWWVALGLFVFHVIVWGISIKDAIGWVALFALFDTFCGYREIELTGKYGWKKGKIEQYEGSEAKRVYRFRVMGDWIMFMVLVGLFVFDLGW